MFLNRKQEREAKLSKKSLIELEDELWRLNQLTKLNKDTRNRMKRLTEVITTKRYAAEKVNEMIDKELKKSKEKMYEEAPLKGQRNV